MSQGLPFEPLTCGLCQICGTAREPLLPWDCGIYVELEILLKFVVDPQVTLE